MKYFFLFLLLITSCAVSPIQSSRIKSNLSFTNGTSFSESYYKFFYKELDTTSTDYNEGSNSLYPVNITANRLWYLSLFPFPSWGIKKRIELSGYLFPSPAFLFAVGGNMKMNLFDLKGKQKLFRSIALALNAGGSKVEMEWDEQSFVLGSLIIGTYHNFEKSELELVFIPSAIKTTTVTRSGTAGDQRVILYAIDLGLGAIFWPGSSDGFSFNGGFFYRIPVSDHVYYDTEFYKVTYKNHFSPWIVQLSFTINLVMP